MRTLLLVALMMLAGGAVLAAVRPPAVAGAFYTKDAESLKREVDEFLGGAPAAQERGALAAIVPHAGYVFSGATAGAALAALKGAAAERVILVGPSHHARFSGGALPDRGIDAFATPLGRVPLDLDALASLRRLPEFDGPADAHGPEHCLEVELPLLQRVAPRAKLVPVLIGADTDRALCRAVARGLASLLGPHTVVVVSTDFTHHGRAYGFAPFAGSRDSEQRLLELARLTAERASAVDPRGFWQQVEVSGDTVCGMRPVAVLLELLSSAFDGRGDLVAVTTSAAVSRDVDRTVSYASVTFSGSWKPWSERDKASSGGDLTPSEKEALLALARSTFATHLGHDASLASWFAGHPVSSRLEAAAGAFVTLKNHGDRARRLGELRACMGVIEAREPLVDAVVHAAVSAAHDPRFPELALDELAELDLEISVLSPTWKVRGSDEIVVGTHGVVLSKAGRAAVFLPQVAPEQGWDRDTMLEHLARKAGLARDAWRSDATFEVFTAQVFGERE